MVDQGRRSRAHRGAKQPGRPAAELLDPPDLAEARAWYAKAAAAGDTRAQYGLGRLLATALEPPELVEARAWWTQSAEAGHIESQYGLRRWLADLRDPPDLAEARTWYTRAASAGRTDAQYDLGVLLQSGWTRRTWMRPATGTRKLRKPGMAAPGSSSGCCWPPSWISRGWPTRTPAGPGPPEHADARDHR